jgi:hypothetical protein
MPPKTENPKAEELRVLLENRGWTTEYECQLDGCHFALTSRADQPRNIVIFEREVFDDWTAKEILHRLERDNWELTVGSNQGKSILCYTNQGFRLKAA